MSLLKADLILAIDIKSNVSYWNDFYKKLALSVPSQFCAMTAVEAPKDNAVIEFGCGNGRDSLYLANQGFNVCAVDLSEEAVAKCSESAREAGLKHAHFFQGSLVNFEDLEVLFVKARGMTDGGAVTGYSRFVMHSINDEQEASFLENLSKLMKSGEKFYFEFRSKEDAALEKTFGNHYRRFVDTDKFVKAQTEEHGFKLKYAITGQGMAKYKSEDPFVSRLIFEKI